MAGRAAKGRGKRQDLDKGLKALFRALEQRPIPAGVRATVDQLEAPARPAPRKARSQA